MRFSTVFAVSVLFFAGLAGGFAAESKPLVTGSSDSAASAAAISATLILQRAQAARAAGDPISAEQLKLLADGVSAGRISLADAVLVVQLAPNVRACAPTPEQDARAHATIALLDGAAPTATTAPEPATPSRLPPAVSPAAAPVAAAPTGPEPIITAAPLMKPAPAAEPKPPVRATVLAVQIGTDQRAALVMLGAGAEQGVSMGQRFIIKRGADTLAQVTIVQVKPRMAAGAVVTNSWTGPDEVIRENDQAVTVQ